MNLYWSTLSDRKNVDLQTAKMSDFPTTDHHEISRPCLHQ